MVRNFNMGKEDQDVDKDRFKLKNSGSTSAPRKKGKKLKTYQQRQNRLGYSFMSMWMVGFVLFTLIPFLFTIYLSLCDVKQSVLGFDFTFIGIDNYVAAFTKNTDLTPALIAYLQNIIPYTFIVVVLSFIIAYLLNKITVGKGVLRTVYFLPVIIMSGPVLDKVTAVNEAAVEAAAKSGHVIVSDYSHIFIMQIIQSYSPSLALFLGSVFDQLSLILWFTGIPIVLFINALQKINVSIYEAAKIDSANAWQIMWKITIPMLRQIGLIVTVFTVIQLGMYKQINTFYELILKLTEQTGTQLGSASAYAWVYSAVVLVLIGIVFLLFREKKGKRGA